MRRIHSHLSFDSCGLVFDINPWHFMDTYQGLPEEWRMSAGGTLHSLLQFSGVLDPE